MITTEQKHRFSGALQRVAGDTELLVSIAALVSEDAPQVYAELKTQLGDGDLAGVAMTGHQLKGMLSTFETDGPTIMVQQLIHAAREGKQREAEETLRHCDRDITNLLADVKQLAASGE